MELILGHATLVGLGCRSVVCVFHTMYRFAQAAGEEQIGLWASVVDELAAFQGPSPMVGSDWQSSLGRAAGGVRCERVRLRHQRK